MNLDKISDTYCMFISILQPSPFIAIHGDHYRLHLAHNPVWIIIHYTHKSDIILYIYIYNAVSKVPAVEKHKTGGRVRFKGAWL